MVKMEIQAKIQQELSQRCWRGSWAYDASKLLHGCLTEVLPSVERLATKVDGRRWFNLFVQFRNKTKAHGAVTNDTIAKIVDDLEKSIRLCLENSVVPKLQWVFVKRNLSGKYHVAGLGGGTSAFDRLKSDRAVNIPDGVYIDLGSPCRVEMIEASIDLAEFYYPNGHFRRRTCEWLSSEKNGFAVPTIVQDAVDALQHVLDVEPIVLHRGTPL